MAATGIYKLDDGSCHLANCFPARSLLRPRYEEGTGHWEVARHAGEQSKFEWLFGSKPTTIKWREQTMMRSEKTLNRMFLMKRSCRKSPSDVCSVNISNQNLVSAQEEDFKQFDCVTHINATENLLTLEVFCKFPALRELELSLNGLRNLKVSAGDFPLLEVLDLSYNNLSPEDIRVLGVLSHLKVLHLTANGLSSLPRDLAVPDGNATTCLMFPALEVLLLDDNHLSDPNIFASLANLQSLKQLNLDRNGIKEVPYLHYVENLHFSVQPLPAKPLGIREELHSPESSVVRRKLDTFSRLSKRLNRFSNQRRENSDRTVRFQPSSLDASALVLGETPSSHPDPKISPASFKQEFALPLSKLRYLSLANNEIKNEEDLLAVALFPSLTELTFYGNPFTTLRSGDPPLLTSFLQNKLGIKLVRKKISKLEKPRIFIPTKANRKVTSPLPKVQKHPQMLEAPLETTFWQLWTGAESDLGKGISLDESKPLPPISSFSVKRSSGSFPDENESEYESLYTLPVSSEEDIFGLDPEFLTSFDQLCGTAHEVPSLLKRVLSAPLPPCSSPLGEQPGLAAPTGSASAEQGTPRPLRPAQGRALSDTNAPVGRPSAEEKLSGPVPSAASSCEGESPPEGSPSAGQLSGEEDAFRDRPSRSSAEDELESSPGTSEEQLGSTLPPWLRVEGRSVLKFHPSIRTLSGKLDWMESVPLTSPFSEEVLPQLVSPTGPLARDQDSAEFLLPAAEQTGAEVSLPIKLPRAKGDQTGSRPPAQGNLLDDLLAQLSSTQQKPARPQLETSLTAAEQGLEHDASQPKALSEKQVPSELGSHVQTSSRNLHLLYQRELSLSSPSGPWASSSESLMEEEMDFFFMTQVEETSGSSRTHKTEETSPPEEPSPKPKRKPRSVLKRYKGYEELLDGPTDPDFVEPRGIQQNVRALEWALRHPLVYREARARLDRFQKPYVPLKKKVLRVPPVRKTKAQKLEEILRRMPLASNVIEFPLVCALRKRKSNWREYREALGLLKEFTKMYKETVTTSCRSKEAVPKQQSGRAQNQPLEILASVKVSGLHVKFPPAQVNEEDKGV